MHRRLSHRLIRIAVPLALVGAAACVQPISKGYEIHTGDVDCDEANRLVYAALRDMRMDVKSFTPAKPGQPGRLRAERGESAGGRLAGEVTIGCEAGRVDIVADQEGDLLGDKEFERGVFLGVTGRGELEVIREGRHATGEVRRKANSSRATRTPAASAAGSTVAPSPAAHETSLVVRLEALRGFASVLDFDADLSACGVLPVKVVIRNGTRRAYEFNPSTIVVSGSQSREKVSPLSRGALERLLADGGASAPEAGEVGDLAVARSLVADKALGSGRISPGDAVEGFVFFPLADYDRARMFMTDVATGESEGFVVDF